jgi:preprotein translocase subunit SecA
VEAQGPAIPQTQGGPSQIQYSGGVGTQQPSALSAAAAGGTIAGAAATGYAEEGELDAAPVVQQRRVDEHDTIGRNDPCWCGSGKKYKKCHGA